MSKLLISLIPASSRAQANGLALGCFRTFVRTWMNMSDSLGIVAERIPIIPDEAGGLLAVSGGAAGLPALLGGAAGLLALSRGEVELPAWVVTIKNPTRSLG